MENRDHERISVFLGNRKRSWLRTRSAEKEQCVMPATGEASSAQGRGKAGLFRQRLPGGLLIQPPRFRDKEVPWKELTWKINR